MDHALVRARLRDHAAGALAIDPVGAQLVGIDVRRLSAPAVACGGALAATAGTLVSTFLSFNPAIGIEFTMKALVVVIMGGIGNMLGSLAAALLLGVAEALCSYYVELLRRCSRSLTRCS